MKRYLLNVSRKCIRARKLKYELQACMGQFVFLYIVWHRAFNRGATGKMLVSQRHDLLMEGFGGSANSFAWWAFRSVNPEPSIAHHLHSAANVILAVRLGKPVLLIVRDPIGCVISLYSRGYIPDLCQGFRHYRMYHRRLLKFRDQIQVVAFEEVISDMGTVTEKLNKRFGTKFNCFEHTEENIKASRAKIRESSKPTVERSERKKLIINQLEEDLKLRKTASEAMLIYKEFIGIV